MNEKTEEESPDVVASVDPSGAKKKDIAPEAAVGEAADASATKKADDDDPVKKKYELIFGFVISLFAAVLALNELAAGKYGDDELQLNSEKTSAYLWYQSKGIKSTLVEGQRDLLRALVEGGAVGGDKVSTMQKQAAILDQKVARYEKEKDEILRGSAAVGKDNWRQEVDGELGKVTGVKPIETKLDQLGKAGDKFDLATLFLQLGLVLGAIGILMSQERMKRVFLGGLFGMGIAGTICSSLALRLAGFW